MFPIPQASHASASALRDFVPIHIFRMNGSHSMSWRTGHAVSISPLKHAWILWIPARCKGCDHSKNIFTFIHISLHTYPCIPVLSIRIVHNDTLINFENCQKARWNWLVDILFLTNTKLCKLQNNKQKLTFISVSIGGHQRSKTCFTYQGWQHYSFKTYKWRTKEARYLELLLILFKIPDWFG